MSNLINAIQNDQTTARTANGAVTHNTSFLDCVDLFAIGAASRGKDITNLFDKAYSEDAEVAVRIMQWIRDVRGGAGERQTFRDLFAWLIENNLEVAKRVLPNVPEIGRWDDVLVAINTPLEPEALELIRAGLNTPSVASLCAKWMPRQGAVAYKLRKYLGMTPKGWRKLVVGLSNTVEQKMCAKQWSEIEYGKLPSKASAMYQNAFKRNDPVRYQKYVDALVKGDEKINAGAIFPHDVVLSAKQGNDKVATEQWKALPNFMEDSGENILPMVDVSGSMGKGVNGDWRGKVQCIDVAIALGLYTAERMGGIFKNHFLTFSAEPTLQKVTGTTLKNRVQNMNRADWDMNTDFQAAFDLILTKAVQNNLSQSDLPSMVLVLSDMEFDAAEGGFWGRRNTEKTNFKVIKQKYAQAGYEMPKLVFWNLNGREGNQPVTIHDTGTALVSGFSPAIMKSLLAAKDMTPQSIMLDTVCVPRYDF